MNYIKDLYYGNIKYPPTPPTTYQRQKEVVK